MNMLECGFTPLHHSTAEWPPFPLCCFQAKRPKGTGSGGNETRHLKCVSSLVVTRSRIWS
jgi:hypothetical protein